jgi:hypothetical protein
MQTQGLLVPAFAGTTEMAAMQANVLVRFAENTRLLLSLH